VLRNIGVSAVYTPKDYVIDTIMADIVRIVGKSAGEPRPDAHKPAPRAAPRRRATRRV
jgi:(2R)-ethylmalonyl-CoA mutase